MPIDRLYQKIRRFFKKFFLIDDTPHKVAAGAALGIFLGIVPGEGVLSTFVLASLLRFNILSATAGVLAANMWTTVAVLPLAAALGGFLFGNDPKELIDNFQNSYHSGWKEFFSLFVFSEVLLPLFTGFVIISLAISLLFYFILYLPLRYKKVRFK